MSTFFLLDTSVQIKRLVSQKWRDSGHDASWVECTPCASIYTHMEFKNSLIAALDFLISVIVEIQKTHPEGGDATARLEEVITHINIDSTKRERDRRVRLANGYAARILSEERQHPRKRTLEDVVETIKLEAENLELVWFFFYAVNGESHKMTTLDVVGCSLGREMSPLDKGRSSYTCKRHQLGCNILGFLKQDFVSAIREDAIEGKLKLNSTRLKEGLKNVEEAMEGGILKEGVSIGEHLCFPIGDSVIVGKAFQKGVGIFTADRDQLTLADLMKVPCLFFDGNANTVVRVD